MTSGDNDSNTFAAGEWWCHANDGGGSSSGSRLMSRPPSATGFHICEWQFLTNIIFVIALWNVSNFALSFSSKSLNQCYSWKKKCHLVIQLFHAVCCPLSELTVLCRRLLWILWVFLISSMQCKIHSNVDDTGKVLLTDNSKQISEFMDMQRLSKG